MDRLVTIASLIQFIDLVTITNVHDQVQLFMAHLDFLLPTPTPVDLGPREFARPTRLRAPKKDDLADLAWL